VEGAVRLERVGDGSADHWQLSNGRLAVPQGPGLGHDPDMDVVERYRVD
jgi:L-alanine-DL-glutamate epimerase-like enolase superfamily enzyme